MDVVLQTCCGPCASACVPRLRAEGHAVTMLFANSNIDTREEFERRRAAAAALAAAEGVAFAALDYDHGEWLREVAAGFEHEPEKGARCARCFRYNLRKASEFAAARGIGAFTTSLTVSPHKPTEAVFAAGEAAAAEGTAFLRRNFKERDGYLASVRRASELGLYRQDYCGCEFSRFRWRLHHRPETASTNLDARGGSHGDVYTADYQTAGRGRLDHVWTSPRGKDLLMSVVLDVSGLDPERVATLPLAVGLAVAKAVGPAAAIKWPNDVFVGGEKVAGILCELDGANAIAGIGVNVGQSGLGYRSVGGTVAGMRARVLAALFREYGLWREKGLGALHPELAARDFLRGRTVSVRQTDDDPAPVAGRCEGIAADGTLVVGGRRVYAGEAHVEGVG